MDPDSPRIGCRRSRSASRRGRPPDVAPAVVAILVTSDPGPWLEDTLALPRRAGLPRARRCSCSTTARPTTRRRASRPRCRGHSCAGWTPNVGFAAAANDAMALVEGATFLLFCHDDVVLDPDAVSVMVEEAYRSNAGIVGPKLVDYDHPEILLEVGMAVDHYGVPFSGIEPDEVDQEQHDAVRDVFFVSDAVDARPHRPVPRARRLRPRDRSRAPTTSTCAGGRGSPARACSSRPTPRVRHRRSTVQDTRPTSRNDQRRPARRSHAVVCACSPSRTRRSRCSGCCRSRSC